MKKKKGFTLIELLVVVAIIGLIGGILVVSLTSARGSANDAKRKADVRVIASAFELYYDELNHYPSWLAGDQCSAAGANCTNWAADPLSVTGSTTYLTALPLDPINSTTYYYRIVDEGGNVQTYCIIAEELQRDSANGWYGADNGAGTLTKGTQTCP